MIGDALVGIILTRNLLAVGVSAGVIPWIDSMGILNTFVVTAATAALVLMIPMPLMYWGRRARRATAARYERYSLGAIPPAYLKRFLAH